MSPSQTADSPDGLTPGGQQLAQRYARAMDLVDRVTRAVEEGNWPFLADEAGALSVAADELAAAASFVTTEDRANPPGALLRAADRQASPAE